MELKRTNSDNEDFRVLVSELDTELWSIYEERQGVYDQHNVIENNPNVIVAYKHNKAVGCGCFKKFDEESVEIKRMYVKPAYRKQKLAASILNALEIWAKELNNTATVLETGAQQVAAIHLYGKSGYIVVQNYGAYKNMPESVCMRKQLA